MGVRQRKPWVWPRALRLLGLAPWRRAPLQSLRSPGLFASVATAGLVLGLAASSRPMFVSSAASETLRQSIESGCRFDVGLRVERQVTLDATQARGQLLGPGFQAASRALDDAVRTPPGIGRKVVTILGGTARLGTARHPTGYPVTLIARTGAHDHVRVIDSTATNGIWVPDVAADRLGLGVGDTVDLRIARPGTAAATVPLAVTGVFNDLRGPQRDASWCSLEQTLTALNNPPPPAVLLGGDVLVDALRRAHVPIAEARWEYAPTGDGWSLRTARATTAALQRVAQDSNNPETPLGAALGGGRSTADSVDSVHQAERASARIESAAGPVALGTAALALVMLVVAARSWVDRRRQELMVLVLHGAGPGAIAAKGVLEVAPPLLLGAGVGVGVAALAVTVVGPGPQIERHALVGGIILVAAAVTCALAAVAGVVASRVRHVGAGHGQAALPSSRLVWEPVVLALAGATFYELRTRGSSIAGDTEVDRLLLLFPVLLLAGGAGVVARILLAARSVRWASGRLPMPGWLAGRRIAATRSHAALIMTGAAVSIGIVVFAGAMSSSLRATTDAKVLLGPGSRQVITLAEPVGVLRLPSTRGISTGVTRTSETGVVTRGHDPTDVLGVDPETFAQAAFWDASFASTSLPNLLRSLDRPSGDGLLPAIVVGRELPDRFAVTVPGADGPVDIGVSVAARVRAFPGYGLAQDRPLVVLDRTELTRRGVVNTPELWVDDDSPAIATDLTAAGVTVVAAARPSAGVAGSTLQAELWAVDYLEIVGLAASLVTIAGLGLHLGVNARDRLLGGAFTRRLGMPAWKGALATATEIAVILVAGLVCGSGLAWLATRLVLPDLDPLPNDPPAAILRHDPTVLALCAVGVLVATLVLTAGVEARTSRASLHRLLRDAA